MLSGLVKARSWRASSFSKFEHSTHDECYGDFATVVAACQSLTSRAVTIVTDMT